MPLSRKQPDLRSAALDEKIREDRRSERQRVGFAEKLGQSFSEKASGILDGLDHAESRIRSRGEGLVGNHLSRGIDDHAVSKGAPDIKADDETHVYSSFNVYASVLNVRDDLCGQEIDGFRNVGTEWNADNKMVEAHLGQMAFELPTRAYAIFRRST